LNHHVKEVGLREYGSDIKTQSKTPWEELAQKTRVCLRWKKWTHSENLKKDYPRVRKRARRTTVRSEEELQPGKKVGGFFEMTEWCGP